MIRRSFLLFFGIILLLSACTKKNKFDVPISESKVNIEIKRLDKDLFAIDLGNIAGSITALKENYGNFFVLYNSRVLNLGNINSPAYPDYLVSFVTDYTINSIYEKTMSVFPEINKIESEINKAFAYYHYYFPNHQIPAVYTFIGGFNQSMVVADSILAIGLDKYLGSDCDFYNRLETPKYIQINMHPAKIPTDALKAWALTEFVYNDSVDNLVNNMVYHGKIQYFLDAMFPETPDTLKFGYTAEQLKWCTNNEKQMWNSLIDQKLLFSTDYMTINKFINPAPFTSGFPNESPGRAAIWLGHKIVQKYMDRHPKITLEQLMKDHQYQKILSESRYEP
jgi:gliding motility-associated lipoprotein GldB